MKIDKSSKYRYLYEYAFYDLIRRHNDGQKAASRRDGTPADYIMASEGRALRAQLGAYVRSSGKAMDSILPLEFRNACDAVLSGRMGRAPYGAGPEGKAAFSGQLKAYTTLLDLGDNNAPQMGEEGILPISPYDPRYSRLDAVLQNGTRLGGVRAGSMESVDDLHTRAALMNTDYLANVSLDADRDGNPVRRFSDRGAKVMNGADALELTKLKRFMSEKDYARCASWVVSGSKTDGMTKADVQQRRRMVDRSVAILEELDRLGRPYEIKPDDRPGQLKACVKGTRVSVRIMDTVEDYNYIGRVYDNGMVITPRSTNTKYKSAADLSELSPEMTVAMVEYGLGEHVRRFDDPSKGIGEHVMYDRIVRGKPAKAHSIYHNDNGTTVVMDNIYENGRAERFGNKLVFTANTTRRSEMTTPMADATEAADYLRDAVATARENYAEALGVDSILAQVEEYRAQAEATGAEPEDFAFVYSGDADVANIQQSYVDVLLGRKATLMRPGKAAAEFEERLSEVGEFETDGAVHTTMYDQEMRDIVYDSSMDPVEMVRRHAADSVDYEIGSFEIGADGKRFNPVYDQEMRDIVYDSSMDPVEMVRRHAADSVDYEIGSFEIGADGKRFNPVGVASHCSGLSVYRNTDDIVKAMRMLDFTADDVKGDNFYVDTVKNKLVKFDAAGAKPMMDVEGPFMRGMYEEIRDSLKHNGVMFDEKNIRIDGNGIVHYSGDIAVKPFANPDGSDVEHIEGELGQFFEPDEHGVVYTNFNGTENYAFVPGYSAHITPLEPGNPKSVEERTILTGYEQSMRQRIRYTLRQELSVHDRDGKYGNPTNMNETYRHLYDERHDYDFVEKFREQGMEEDVLWAIVETEAARVRYDNTVRDGSTIHAAYQAERYDRDMANDNTGDAFVLTGGRNMAVLTEESDGYFDPIATTATSTNQGTLRFLVQGAKVGPDGHIVPSEDKGDRCAFFKHDVARNMSFNTFDRQNMTLSNVLQASAITRPANVALMTKGDRCAFFKHDVARNMSFNTFDRQNMTLSNVLQASAITRPANVALMTFGGWTMDDPIVVSKKFASEYRMRNRDGHLRDLVAGDKISDLHGNKGVISLVIDPDMPLEEAEERGIRDQVEWFKANPDLDMVMAPFPAVSRFNGGTAREMMERSQDLVDPKTGEVRKGEMGAMRMIVTDKAADTKTHVYDDDEVRMGHGRKASAQMAWALNSKDCPAIMRECFGNNGSALANVREMLITCGLDISETGELRVGYQPHEGETRRVIEMDEPMVRGINKNGMPSMNNKEMSAKFVDVIAKQGGVLEVPFELKYPTGEPIAPMNDNKTDVVYTKTEWERKGYFRKDGTWVRGTTVTRRAESGQRTVGEPTYGLPVMSSYLRSGQTFADGTSSVHDYTHQYMDIYLQSMLYKACDDRLKTSGLSDDERKTLEAAKDSCRRVAQSRFDNITSSVKSRAFEGKHNVFRDDIMSHKMPNSATAVWTADPRLDIDEVAVGRAMAESIGIEDGQHVLIWRDPVLRDGGLRYLKAKIDDELTGVAINPVMDKSESIGIEDGQHVLIWRDPVLRDGGLRYLKAKIDDELTGVAINPVMDKSFDGDFDGDTVAVVNLRSKSAQREAMDKFSVEANLLDYGTGKDGAHSLFMQQSLDVKVAQSMRPELKAHFEDIEDRVNKFEAAGANGDISPRELRESREAVVEELSSLYRDSFDGQCGSVAIRFDSLESHLNSVKEACLDTGAKGSPKALGMYCKWLGAELRDPKELDFEGCRDAGHTLAQRKDHEGVMVATAVKSFGTGIAGSFSQRGVSAMRNECQKAVLELTYPVTQSLLQAKHNPDEALHKTGIAGSFSQRGVSAMRNECQKAVLELTYPVTQSLLQAKHNPDEALHKYRMLMGPARDLWRGYAMAKDENGEWRTKRNAEGTGNEPASVDEWKAAFKEIYLSEDGLNVNINEKWVDEVAEALRQPGTNVMRNLEEEESATAAFKEIYLSEDGLNVNINEKWVDEVAEALRQPGTNVMRNLEEEESATELCSPLDRLAYGGNFEMLTDMAKNGEDLFRGKYNAQFAPRTVRMNKLAQEQRETAVEAGVESEQEAPVMRSFGKSDTMEGRKLREAQKRSVAVGSKPASYEYTPKCLQNKNDEDQSDHGGLGD